MIAALAWGSRNVAEQVAGSALLGFWENPRWPIPVMDIHGIEDRTIPANYSNGFIGHGADSSGVPLKVPGCDDCAFADDGFYCPPHESSLLASLLSLSAVFCAQTRPITTSRAGSR